MASTLTGQGVTVSNIVDYMSLIEQRSMQVSNDTVIENYKKASIPDNMRAAAGMTRELQSLGS